MAMRQLVIVDDNAEVRDIIATYAKARAWKVFTSNGDEIPRRLGNRLPTLVLLDYVLAGAGPATWVEGFRRQYPSLAAKVYLLTGLPKNDQTIEAFSDTHKLSGILRKPFDLERLEILFREEGPGREAVNAAEHTPKDLVFETAEHSPFALRLLDARSLQVLYENPTARENPLNKTSRRGMQMLARQLEESNEISTRNVEWDSQKQAWRTHQICRSGQRYWMTTEWLQKTPEIFLSRTWEERITQLGAIGAMLETEFGITRTRFYRVLRLYRGSKDEKLLTEMGKDNETEKGKYNEPSFVLLQPEWQRGEGFDPSAEAWLHSESKVDEKSNCGQLLANATGRWLIQEVSDGNRETYEDFESIRWGNATHRALVPLRRRDMPTATALLVLDRRSDHLPTRFVQDLPPPTTIDDHDMRLMAGLLAWAKPMFLDYGDYVEERNNNTLKDWNATLTQIIQDNTDKPDARAAITHTLQSIAQVWDKDRQPIRDTYLVRVHGDGLLEAWAGTGPLWETSRGRVFEAEAPFDEALLHTTVIHNFPAWYQGRSGSERESIDTVFNPRALDGIGSWLGTPIKQGNRTLGVFVVGATRPHYFTMPRVRALEKTPARLLPMLLWGLAQAQREWLRGVFAHEYRERVSPLFSFSEYLPETKSTQYRLLLRYLSAVSENLRLLGEEGTAQATRLPAFEDTCINTLLEQVAETMQFLYPHQRFAGLEQLPRLDTHVPGNALYQVLFNLLENACKFGLEEDPISLSATLDADTLLLNIRNRSPVPISARDQDRIFLPYKRAENAPNARGAGIGLAVVRRLCNALGMRCELSQPGTPEHPEVCFTLEVPLAQSKQAAQERTSYA